MLTTQHLKNAVRAPLEELSARLGPHKYRVQPKLWTLMYHRILPKSDPRYAIEEPGMIVEPETFRLHLQLLKRFFTIFPLAEWISRQQQGKPLPHNACCITFDDGWADNYEYAMPIIESEQVPITLFVVSDLVDTTKQFWPNQINKLCSNTNKSLLLEHKWLADCTTAISGDMFSREEISHIIHQLKHYSDDYIHNKLAELTDQLGTNNLEKSLIGWAQLRKMVNSGLVDIGSHTCNHFRLQNTLDKKLITREIVDSKARLKEELSTSIDLFCYPNGDTCPLATELVRKHYKGAVTTQRGINNTSNANPHLLKRIGIHQDTSNTSIKFQARLSNWF